jgi:BirA family biotin operon repressor/biotin-[acetyl-CoA-carboxylase] ligase
MTSDPVTISSLEPLPAELAGPLAVAAERLGIFGRRHLWYPAVSSTSDVAAGLAGRGVEEGLVVLADAQTAGRGRHGRTWVSPPGAGLYVSVVLRPPTPVSPVLTLGAGVAVAEGIDAATGLRVELKWPNDLHVAGRKLGGLLAEATSGCVVLGMGINVRRVALPRELAPSASSIEEELGRPVDRGALPAACLAALARRYQDLRDGREHAIMAAWRARGGAALGRRVEWDAGASSRAGLVEQIDDDGALLVRAGADLVRIVSGEVRWI